MKFLKKINIWKNTSALYSRGSSESKRRTLLVIANLTTVNRFYQYDFLISIRKIIRAKNFYQEPDNDRN